MLSNLRITLRRTRLALGPAFGLGLGLGAVLLAAVPASSAVGGGSVAQSAGADCYSIGQQVASENGGTLAKASATTQDGQTVCVIVVLVPGKEGQRPRRAEFVVAAQ